MQSHQKESCCNKWEGVGRHQRRKANYVSLPLCNPSACLWVFLGLCQLFSWHKCEKKKKWAGFRGNRVQVPILLDPPPLIPPHPVPPPPNLVLPPLHPSLPPLLLTWSSGLGGNWRQHCGTTAAFSSIRKMTTDGALHVPLTTVWQQQKCLPLLPPGRPVLNRVGLCTRLFFSNKHLECNPKLEWDWHS